MTVKLLGLNKQVLKKGIKVMKIKSVNFEETHQEFETECGDTLYMQLPDCPDSQHSVNDECNSDFDDEKYGADTSIIEACENYIFDNCASSVAISCVSRDIDAHEIMTIDDIIVIESDNALIFAKESNYNSYYNVYMLNEVQSDQCSDETLAKMSQVEEEYDCDTILHADLIESEAQEKLDNILLDTRNFEIEKQENGKFKIVAV